MKTCKVKRDSASFEANSEKDRQRKLAFQNNEMLLALAKENVSVSKCWNAICIGKRDPHRFTYIPIDFGSVIVIVRRDMARSDSEYNQIGMIKWALRFRTSG